MHDRAAWLWGAISFRLREIAALESRSFGHSLVSFNSDMGWSASWEILYSTVEGDGVGLDSQFRFVRVG